jgi:hypothetical protein
MKKTCVDVFLGLFGGLAVLSHPEAAVHTLVSAIFLWLMLSRKKATFISSILVGLIVLIVTVPWWATVIHYHGLQPLINGAQTGKNVLAVFHLLFFVFTEEPYATVIAILGLLGIGISLARREYLLPLWMVIPFFVEGRSAPGPAAIPLAMLAAIGFIDVVVVAIQAAARKVRPAAEGNKQNGGSSAETISSLERNLSLYLLLYLIFSAYQFGFGLSSATLYPPDQEAMNWVSQNMPAEARFLVLTGTTSVSCDSVLEWFPALTDRQSVYTVQGTEWTQGENFAPYVRATYDVQECLLASDVSCLDSAISPSQYDYIYLSKILRVNNCRPVDIDITFPYFLEQMRTNERVEIVYETDGVIVYRNR